MRTRYGVIAILLIVGGLAAVLLSREQDGSNAPAAPTVAEPPPPAAPLPPPPALSGRGVPAPAASAPPAPALPMPALPTPPPPPAGNGDGPWLVRGALHDRDAALGGATRATAYPVHHVFPDLNRGVEGAPFEGDAFELDVGELFSGERQPTHVEVLVDHPAYAKVRVRIDVQQAQGRSPRVLAFEASLRRAYAITGTVLEAGGEPVAGAPVALFPLEDGEPLRSNIEPIQPSDDTATDAEGRYRLRALQERSFLIVAAAAGLQPAARAFERRRAEDLSLDPLHFHRGVTIEGRLTWRGDPIPGATVRATNWSGMALSVGGAGLGGDGGVSWREGKVFAASGEATTDAHGRYRIRGLSPRTYAMGYSNVDLPGIDSIAPQWSLLSEHKVDAPAVGVDMAIQGAWLHLVVEGAGAPVADAGVVVARGGSFMSCVTQKDGALDVLLGPNEPSTLQITADGFVRTEVVVETGAPGTRLDRSVGLEPATEQARLVLEVAGEGADELLQVGVTMIRDPGGSAPAPPTRKWPRREDGAFPLEGIDPGTYRVDVDPGGRLGQPGGYYLPTTHTVTLPAGGDVRIPVELRVGGRLRVAARDTSGALLAAGCVIRNDRGEAIQAAFHSQAGTVATFGPETLGLHSPSLVDPALPAGTYVVELSMDGRASLTQEVEVRARVTTDVDVALPAR